MIQSKSPPGSSDYFTRRESQERTLAALAVDRAVKCAHLAMADRYAALSRDEARLIIKPVAA